MDQDRWRHYLAAYHDERPGITERFLGRADTSPYAWLAEPLRGRDGPVLDLACGSAPVRPLLAGAHWLGVDASPGELAAAARAGRGPLIRGDAARLPVVDGTVDAVCAAMCLPVLTPRDRVLAEIRRVLRPDGMLAALVPATRGLSPAGLARWARVMATLGTLRQPWPDPHARDGLAHLLRHAGFEVIADEPRVFTLALTGTDDGHLLVDALYLPHLSADRTRAAKKKLGSWAASGRRLELPLRRVVARRG
ncbi:class I SAM-dependent methyltransferase [Actinacidiphila acididurans]|uniref:class I SAM-dependent methyltransferase n=1 Tax=Actinacidiphila acididurans TaxID=2784346 RepID=UPI0027DBB7CD|nr:methyltransferase domain-containing protein [Actinacidiphila acididurans]